MDLKRLFSSVGIAMLSQKDIQELLPKLITHFARQIDIGKCSDLICNNKSLLEPVTEEHWRLIRKAARKGDVSISYEEVVDLLNTHRPDVLGVIITTQGGVNWLQRQVADIQAKLQE